MRLKSLIKRVIRLNNWRNLPRTQLIFLTKSGTLKVSNRKGDGKMATIKLSQSFVDLMKKKHFDQKILLLIADDGGGRYSLQGGACSIGTKFSLIVLDEPDPDYQVKLENDAGLQLYTSDYDMIFFASGLAMDFKQGAISIKDDAHAYLDGSVRIAKGSDVLAAFKKGIMMSSATC